jgi:hypothetical protein
MPHDPTFVLSIHLIDLRVQLESQLRRIADAEHHWRASQNGTDGASLARIGNCLEQMSGAAGLLWETCADARQETTDLLAAVSALRTAVASGA